MHNHVISNMLAYRHFSNYSFIRKYIMSWEYFIDKHAILSKYRKGMNLVERFSICDDNMWLDIILTHPDVIRFIFLHKVVVTRVVLCRTQNIDMGLNFT